MDFLNKFLYKNDHKFTEFFASQEFSRKICEWNIYYIKTVEVGLISEFLNKNRILAGGAVSNILSYEEVDREDSDYDIFFVKKNPCKFLEKIRNNYDYYETFNSISINYKKIKIQFIKRLYENENRVVGGFDLDPCRFFMNHKGEIYGTANAIKSLENRRMYINPCCQSRNFYSRIYKYCKEKGYKDIHIHTSINKLLFKGDNDYCNYYTSSDIRKDEMVIINLLFSGNYDKLFVKKKIFTYKELRDGLDEIFRAIEYPNALASLFVGLTKKPVDIYKITVEDCYEFLKIQYKEYRKITDILISNTSSQMTASFHPTNYSLRQIYPKFVFDIFKDHLRAIFEVIYFSRMPKVITYKIFRDYYDLNFN